MGVKSIGGSTTAPVGGEISLNLAAKLSMAMGTGMKAWAS